MGQCEGEKKKKNVLIGFETFAPVGGRGGMVSFSDFALIWRAESVKIKICCPSSKTCENSCFYFVI